jgi:TRAP-type C4-dicarboxylate transport system permease large subunit
MAKVTLVFAVLLIILGAGFYFGTGSKAPTALIPAWFGVALGFFGLLAISPSESRRKLYMHINVTIGLLGFLGAAGRAISVLASGRTPDQVALIAQFLVAGLLLIYVILCVRSFIAARRARLV